MTHTQETINYVFDFADGNMDQKDLLGGKGANLAEMTRIGLPVPPGFTIATTACKTYLATGDTPAGLAEEISDHLHRLENVLDRRLGDRDDPLLVSVRSGARFSMPGMMETILDIGLNDESVHGLAKQSGDDHFAWDSYRRLLQMYARTVLDLPDAVLQPALAAEFAEWGVSTPEDLPAAAIERTCELLKRVIAEHSGSAFPQDPLVQLDHAVRAVFSSWSTARATLYRRQEHIADDLGTAVNVMAMVFGNRGGDSGTGVAFTRDPGSGATGVYGDYLQNAQGEDVVAGVRNTVPLAQLEIIDPANYAQLVTVMATLEHHYQDLCDIEFTIERGRLWILQTRVGKRTAAAAFRIATQLVDEGVITLDEALLRVTGAQLGQLMFPRFAADHDQPVLVSGVGASPGAAVGVAAFDSDAAQRFASKGRPVILIRRETNPDDLPGMIASKGILTTRGGKTSHAAVVARGMGKPCVCGAEQLVVDVEERMATAPGQVVIREGDLLSLDGLTGVVYRGEVPVVASPVVEYFESSADLEGAQEVVKSVDRILRHADQRRTLGVHANADTPTDAQRARRFGAEGIGLCRTEHLFLGARRQFVERLILAEGPAEQQAALDELQPLQRADFTEIFRSMDGLPVTIRLIDPPLHEFLPDLTTLSVQVALAKDHGEHDADTERLLGAVRRIHETNPMLGLRGVRLGIAIPGLFAMQTRAIAEAAARVSSEGVDVRPEIMVPLVASDQEMVLVRAEIERVLAEVSAETGGAVTARIGTMIEVPRAALSAASIARHADFFSFGTNDLTQLTWAFSRDDVEASVFPRYLDAGIFAVSPFESLDRSGVGRLVQLAVDEGRKANPDLVIGVCGEHGGDPDSIAFFAQAGLDYVSCSPFRIPVARLEAGRAAIAARSTTSDTR
ncbi:pyruvate, phosphate dikinase [Streptomyces sp. SID13031]|uniref:pyruvate, phosphate dikinase n=1 Tax=Streptomyces sp. SID13031 TaxID=2706046 RepID=UPI0013C7688B|nr:pyruvate, phosphate dikinase [Streptomyces sp. SID13031]NEA32368.1 pyruvate, phosphate dikinase [Streptomyces sp. SID13031]